MDNQQVPKAKTTNTVKRSGWHAVKLSKYDVWKEKYEYAPDSILIGTVCRSKDDAKDRYHVSVYHKVRKPTGNEVELADVYGLENAMETAEQMAQRFRDTPLLI